MAVYWTSMIYMVLYIPLIFPASWLLDKKVSFQNMIISDHNMLVMFSKN